MTINVWPLDASSGAPVYSGRKLRQTTVSPFSAMGAPSRPLGARSGIRPGTPASVFSMSGTTWSVGMHIGIVDLAAADGAGAYAYANDAAVTGATNAAHASLTRWDLLYAELSDTAESAGTGAPRVDIKYQAGAASATPSLPAAPNPTRSMPLARIVSPPAGGGSPTIVPIAPFYGVPGAPLTVRDGVDLGTWAPENGAMALNLSNGIIYVRRAGTWKGGDVALTTDSVYDKHVAPYNAVAICDDGEVYLEGLIRNSALFGANAGQRYVLGSIPAAYAPIRTLRFGSVSVLGFAVIEVTTTGEIAYWIASSVSNVVAGAWNLSLSGLRWKVQ